MNSGRGGYRLRVIEDRIGGFTWRSHDMAGATLGGRQLPRDKSNNWHICTVWYLSLFLCQNHRDRSNPAIFLDEDSSYSTFLHVSTTFWNHSFPNHFLNPANTVDLVPFAFSCYETYPVTPFILVWLGAYN